MNGRFEPGMPEAVVRPIGEVEVVNGRPTLGLNITVTPDVLEQYRQGYRCIACHHGPQPKAFPEHCSEPYCRFPMRRDQAAELARQMRGEEDLWPDDHEDDDGERRDRLERDGFWLPG